MALLLYLGQCSVRHFLTPAILRDGSLTFFFFLPLDFIAQHRSAVPHARGDAHHGNTRNRKKRPNVEGVLLRVTVIDAPLPTNSLDATIQSFPGSAALSSTT
jgi:hypothetical protein